jgi:hypothetical protein
MNIIKTVVDLVQNKPECQPDASVDVKPNPSIQNIHDLTTLLQSNEFIFPSTIHLCLYTISIDDGWTHITIHELFLPQYNVCLNAEDDCNIFVSAKRYNEKHRHWTPALLIATLEIKSGTEVHTQLCDLMKTFVDFHVQKSKIAQLFNVVGK